MKILKDLLKLADQLDAAGLTKEAMEIDVMVKKAQDRRFVETLYDAANNSPTYNPMLNKSFQTLKAAKFSDMEAAEKLYLIFEEMLSNPNILRTMQGAYDPKQKFGGPSFEGVFRTFLNQVLDAAKKSNVEKFRAMKAEQEKAKQDASATQEMDFTEDEVASAG